MYFIFSQVEGKYFLPPGYRYFRGIPSATRNPIVTQLMIYRQFGRKYTLFFLARVLYFPREVFAATSRGCRIGIARYFQGLFLSVAEASKYCFFLHTSTALKSKIFSNLPPHIEKYLFVKQSITIIIKIIFSVMKNNVYLCKPKTIKTYIWILL